MIVRGINYAFSFINICKVQREVLKNEGKACGFQHFLRDLANVNRGINHDFPFISIRTVLREVMKTKGEA